ncbi:hypothetical protein [Lactococcus fujiensis]|uniref:PRD domain-containing protein n=1 Tax=Lactococcus fujiensis JCM 16395 TaxID=1291764 RepID=A0A2A5RQ01_9LACT|nr:hypothetical protein [Lactococcus fujiensis]PCS01517.1 hypothetical protein RT41_GL000281 [Lactococcus fujiensis JCM 16395]
MPDLQKLIDEQCLKSQHPEEFKTLVTAINNELNNDGLEPSEIQWVILLNHVDEMLTRNHNEEYLPEMEATLFAELTDKSLEMAVNIIKSNQKLAENEKYLLAVHMENILGNIN